MQTIHRDCVVGLIVSSDGKILLGKKNPRAGGVYPDAWHLPGGGIEPGESHHDALVREVKEETGINIIGIQADFIDGAGYGESTKTDKATGEQVLCRMTFYTYRIHLPYPAANIRVRLESDLVEAVWASVPELANYWLTPPSMILFSKLGYI
ncbi:MAG TPA: NUDIX hydrolase [Candidatus Saccharimonadales bacterium]